MDNVVSKQKKTDNIGQRPQYQNQQVRSQQKPIFGQTQEFHYGQKEFPTLAQQ